VGTHDRDNTFFGHKPFFVIADYLTRRGIAVLRYDEIPGRVTATTADFAADVNSAVRYLKEKEYVNNIGILGHSEGGLIAALAAAEFPDIAYIILMASPGLKGDIYNCQFEASMGKAMGLSDFEIERKLQLQRAVIAAVLKSTSDVEAEDEIRKLYYNFDNKISSSQIDAAIQRFLSPWFKYSIKSDPGLVLQKVICPVLAIFGEKDWQVPPEGNMEAVIDALKETGNTDYKVIVMAEHNHYMQNASTGKPDEYDRIEETISEDVLRLISSWILERQ
jgi:pimeloyl-ACP methyl ester carboxylesterase